MEPVELARAYYDAIDADEYDRLRELLAPEFTQERGDRTFENREEFVDFMRDNRPERDTTHEIQHVTADGNRVVAEGTLRRANGEVWFRFADAFVVDQREDALIDLRTYTI